MPNNTDVLLMCDIFLRDILVILPRSLLRFCPTLSSRHWRFLYLSAYVSTVILHRFHVILDDLNFRLVSVCHQRYVLYAL